VDPAGTGYPVAGQAPVDPAGTSYPVAEQKPSAGLDRKGKVRRTRVSEVWVGFIAVAIFMILLVVFIAQNSRAVTIHFFGWHGQFSLGLTILLSAVIGMLLVAIPGSIRIVQLRRALLKNAHPKEPTRRR
jgi:uncharacterized integral membrane protein